MDDVSLYLARRDAYAAFLAAADAESDVAWHRVDGRHPDESAAVAAVDAAYATTRGAFTLIEVEGTGPVAEGSAVLTQLAAMHKEHGSNPDWKAFEEAREAFLLAATGCLQAMRDDH
ncbi:hypothetical protein ACIRL0_35760 [Streptomyces sp. NPDC102365]|uniref:hypothetical protein n=1 Tax=Streptomyces sp. NPDC102365 TaxID=3366162 RepID=UPI00381BF754